MSAGKPETSAEAMEQELAARLASFDELLKAGDTSRAQKVTPHDGREASPDLERAQDCLRLLEAVWPRAVASPPTLRGLGPTGSLAPLRPASAPVQLGRFLIRRQLGRGGFGTVYLADDCHLHREVALKVPHTDAFLDNDLRARFQQEARAAASLDHPNLVQVYEAGEIDSVAYIALAYCPGINLADWLKQRTEPVPCVAAAELVVTLASAVHHAHQNGVVHRDLKPSNILLVPSGGEAAVSADDLPVPLVDGHWPLHKLAPKITDFGLAKHAGARAPLTRTGTILGTPCYMAPEQTGNTGVTTGPAADVYSLGAILYELLTHRPPFQGDSPLEVLHQVRFQEPLTLRRLRPSLPRDLDTICLKCLEKDPAKRYASAGALAADLRRYLDHKPIQARPVGMVGRIGKWIRRRPATAALVSVSSVAAVLLLVILIVSDVEIRQKHQEAERANQRLEFANTLIRREKDHAEKAFQRERRVSYFRSIALAHHNWQASYLGNTEKLLRECPEDLRGWEWRHLRRLCHLDLASTVVHRGPVSDLAFTEDGVHCATAGAAGVHFWKATTLSAAPDHDLPLTAWSALSRNGRFAAAKWDNNTLKVWDLTTGKERIAIAGKFPDRISHLAFSRDSGLLAAAIAMPSGKVVTPQSIIVWNLTTGQQVAVLREKGASVAGLEFSNNGKRLAAPGPDGMVRVLDVGAGKEQLALKHSHQLNAAVFSPDDRWLATACSDSHVRLWNAATGKLENTFRGHGASVLHVAFSNDGQKLASAGADGTVRIWDVNSGRELLLLRGHTVSVRRVAFSPDDRRIASGDVIGTVKVWDSVVSRERLAIDGSLQWTAAIAFPPDGGQVAIAGQKGGVKFFNADTGAPAAHWPAAGCVISFNGGRIITGGGKNMWDVHVRRADGGDVLFELPGHHGPIVAVAVSPDGRYCAVAGYDHLVKVWDMAARELLFSLEEHSGIVRCLTFSPTGTHLVSGSDDRTARIWNMKTGKTDLILSGHEGPVLGIAYNPKGDFLASASQDHSLRFWNPENGETKAVLRGHTQAVFAIAFHPDGKRIASASADQTVKLWDTTTGDEAFVFRGHTQLLTAVAFSRDGVRLAAGSRDGTVLVWDAPADPAGADERVLAH